MNYSIRFICLALAICVNSASQHARADFLTFEVQVNQSTLQLGESVTWSLFATVSDSSPSNWGISSISANLFDSPSEIILPATTGPAFASYSFNSGGTFNGMNGKLLEISSTLFTQSNSVAQAINPANSATNNSLGPLLVATGSYTATKLGSHTLSAEAGSANTFFTAAGQLLGNGGTFVNGTHRSAVFVVLPEPNALLSLLAVTACSILARKRRTVRS